jgi:hypothetical protein
MRRYVLTALFCLVGATAVQAQGLPDVPAGTVLTEVMMNAQAMEAQLYGALAGTLGVSLSSPQSVSGTTFADVSSGNFSFSLNPGQSCLGQAISDSVQGQFNPATGAYEWTGSGKVLGVAWQLQGDVIPNELDMLGPKWQLQPRPQFIFPGPGFLGVFSTSETVTIYGPGNPTPAFSEKTTTWLLNGQPYGTPTTGFDFYDGKTGKVTDLIPMVPGGMPLKQLTTVTTPITGGPGTYTTTISSVPEPSSWVLGLLGGLGMLGYAWWRRKSAGARVPAVGIGTGPDLGTGHTRESVAIPGLSVAEALGG